eukprot:gene7983-16336_t
MQQKKIFEIKHMKSFIVVFCIVLDICAGRPKTFVQTGNLKLSPIGCGTWAWGNRLLWGYDQNNDTKLLNTFKYVVSNGINWFDTADSYGTGSYNGRSEELLGQFLKELSIKERNKLSICTKIAPYPWRIGYSSFENAARQSIYRLQRPIDMIQLHWPPFLGWQELEYFSALNNLVNNGEATQIGLSNYGPKTLRRAAQFMGIKGNKIFSNQVQFSLLSRYPLTNGLSETCNELNIQLIGYSSLALGLLSDSYSIDKLPNGPRSILFREYLPAIQPLLGELRDIAKSRGKSVAQVALNWSLSKNALVLVGMRTVDQAKDNLGADGWRLTPAEVEVLDRVAAKNPKQLVQNSFQGN